MDYPKRPTEGMTFKITGFVKKFFQKWDTEQNKMIKSDTWMEGMSAKYLFDIEGGQLELSKDQLGQVFIGAFEEKKHWKECVYVVRTNGKSGMEVRYFINVSKPRGDWGGQYDPNAQKNAPTPPTTPNTAPVAQSEEEILEQFENLGR